MTSKDIITKTDILESRRSFLKNLGLLSLYFSFGSMISQIALAEDSEKFNGIRIVTDIISVKGYENKEKGVEIKDLEISNSVITKDGVLQEGNLRVLIPVYPNNLIYMNNITILRLKKPIEKIQAFVLSDDELLTNNFENIYIDYEVINKIKEIAQKLNKNKIIRLIDIILSTITG
jgi:hypothetical protein